MNEQNNYSSGESESSSHSHSHHKHHSSSGSSHHSSSSKHHSSHSGSEHHSSSHHSSSSSSSGHHSSSSSSSSSKHHSSSSSHHSSSSKHHSSSSSHHSSHHSRSSSSSKPSMGSLKKKFENVGETEEQEPIITREEKQALYEKREELKKKFADEKPAEAAAEKKEEITEKLTDLAEEDFIITTGVKGGKKKKEKSKKKKILLGILLFIFLLILVAMISLIIMIQMGKKNLLDFSDSDITALDGVRVEDDGKTVYYDGKIYKLDENITSIACLGVDKTEINANGVIGSAGQADTIMIVAYDTSNGQATIIPIPRDAITDIDVYASDGSYVRTEKTQICLSYAFGDGGKTSCENVVASAQKLMHGMPINSYAALDLEGIAPLNDAVGGVTVTVQEGFGEYKTGQTVTLKGDKAMGFVRYRDTLALDSNVHRMGRQIQYVREFTKTAVKQTLKDFSTVTNLYKTAGDYSYTDIDLSRASFIVSKFISGTGKGEFSNVTVKGEVVEGDDGYAEFHIDEKAFYEMILSIYYDVIGEY